jgi:8-oxo-dGTP diphosphatase
MAAKVGEQVLGWLGVHVWRRLPGWAQEPLIWWLNARFVVGTVAIIEDTEGRVLIARHTYRRRTPWGLPGGWVRRGEAPDETIVRELREETDLTIAVLGPLTIQRESPRHLTIVYAARLTGGRPRSSREVSEIRFVTPGAWPDGMRPDHRVLIQQYAGSRTAGGTAGAGP